MYGIIKVVIESGRFELVEMLKKIDKMWLEGNIADEQREELITLALALISISSVLLFYQLPVHWVFFWIPCTYYTFRRGTDILFVFKSNIVIPVVPFSWYIFRMLVCLFWCIFSFFFAESDIYVLYPSVNEEFVSLSAEEQELLNNLHTYYPATVISNSV